MKLDKIFSAIDLTYRSKIDLAIDENIMLNIPVKAIIGYIDTDENVMLIGSFYVAAFTFPVGHGDDKYSEFTDEYNESCDFVCVLDQQSYERCRITKDNGVSRPMAGTRYFIPIDNLKQALGKMVKVGMRRI